MADPEVQSSNGYNTAKVSGGVPVGKSSVSGYVATWQAVLKILKMLGAFCCMVSAGVIRSSYNTGQINYCLSVAVIILVLEAVVFFVFLVGLVDRFNSSVLACGSFMLVYHTFLMILLFVSCVMMTGITTPPFKASRAYSVFGILTLQAFFLEIYFNIKWLRGGLETEKFLS